MQKSTGTYITIFVVVFLGVFFCCRLFQHNRVTDQRKQATDIGASEAYAISRQLDRSLSAAYALASILRAGGKMDDFEGLAGEMISRYGGISSLQLAPDGVVSMVYPLRGNEAAIGHDLLNDPRRRAGAIAAIASRNLTLVGPFSLIQGGVAVIGRYPVFLNDTGHTSDTFWGFTIVMIRMGQLLEDCNFGRLMAAGYDYRLCRVGGENRANLVISESLSDAIDEPVMIDIPVSSGAWQLQLAPAAGWQSPLSLVLHVLISVLAGAVAFAAARRHNQVAHELETSNRLLTAEIEQRRRTATALLHAKVQAEETAQFKGDFLASMSHEIRTPLNALLGFIQLAEQDEIPDQTREYLQISHSAGKHLAALVDDILDLSKIEAGGLTIEHEPCDIDAILDSTANLAASLTAGKAHSVQLCRRRDQAVARRLTGDPLRLQQIMNNLIGNAVKFTDKGVVEYGVRQYDLNWVQWFVRDSGPGIPADRQKDIFKAFRQAERSTSRCYGGTGLGLAITQKLVQLMGGRIEVKSEVGEGSEFIVTLPYEPVGNAATATTASTAGVRPEGNGGSRVLIVEDDSESREMLQSLLTRWGYDVESAINGRDAVAIFRDNPDYAFVLMDLRMPEMDGIDATTEIRNFEKKKRIERTPIIAVTANAARRDGYRIRDAGCDRYLAKPIDTQKLRSMIATLAGESNMYSLDDSNFLSRMRRSDNQISTN